MDCIFKLFEKKKKIVYVEATCSCTSSRGSNIILIRSS